MPVKTEKDLPENLRPTWLRAMSAMQLRNYGYAIQLLQTILKTAPDFLGGRQLLRKAAVAKNTGKKSILGGISSASFSTMKVQSLVKKDPLAAMDAVEKILEAEPYNPQANQLLKDAALGAKIPEIAMFALETIIEGNPKDTKTMHELGKLYMQNDLPKKAITVYEQILMITPNDLAAVKGSKDAAAGDSMQRGGWELEQTTYRDLIKDKEQAVNLEQENRVVRSDEMIDNLLIELHQKVEQEPENIDAIRRVAELYEQKGDIDNALEWFTYAVSVTKSSDPSFVRKASDLRLKQYDASIKGFEEYIAANPDLEETKQYIEQLEDIKRQRAELLMDETKKRVERNPTDFVLRFELGELLVNVGNYKDAIQELQKAKTNPSVRLRAMSLLGKCFTARNMYDLAAKTLTEAASEIPQMDSIKKEIIYSLGLVYEKMGQMDKSIDCMKQIYEVDYSYRDVADRVEGSYGGGAAGAAA